jgi:hypothetical protein
MHRAKTNISPHFLVPCDNQDSGDAGVAAASEVNTSIPSQQPPEDQSSSDSEVG